MATLLVAQRVIGNFITDEDDRSPNNGIDLLLGLRKLKGVGNVDGAVIALIMHDNPALLDASSKADLATMPHAERNPEGLCGQAPLDQGYAYYLLEMVRYSPYPAFATSICADFATSLTKITSAAAGLLSVYTLSSVPDPTLTVPCPDKKTPAQVCVRVNDRVLAPAEFTFNTEQKTITFTPASTPPAQARIVVDYAEYVRGRKKDKVDEATCSTDADCPTQVKCNTGLCKLACSADADCRSGFACAGGVCRCASDASCGAGQSCTASGACQPKPACRNSAECNGGVCDFTTGQCLPAGACAQPTYDNKNWQAAMSAWSCPAGQFCEAGACKPGCLTDMECAAGSSCDFSAGKGVGTCVVGCTRNDQCCANQRCQNGGCVTAMATPSHPLCDETSCTGANPSCHAAGGQCAFTYSMPSACFASCNKASDCPSGYACTDLPTSNTTCTPNGNECTGGRVCTATAENPKGYCSCLSNADCPEGTCEPTTASYSYCFTGKGACLPYTNCQAMRTAPSLWCTNTF